MHLRNKLTFRKQNLHQGMIATVHGLRQVTVEMIIVFINKTNNRIGNLKQNGTMHVSVKRAKSCSRSSLGKCSEQEGTTHSTGVMPKTEALWRQRDVGPREVFASLALEVGAVLAHLGQLVQKALVSGGPRPKALFIQHRQDAVVILPRTKQRAGR